MPSEATTPAHLRSRGDQSWQSDAECQVTGQQGMDPELFFPGPDEMDKIRTAKALCSRCPVRRTCLEAALETGDTHGIRGGLTEEERAPLHDNLPARLDRSRVDAFVAGHDVYLTKAERRAVVHAAYRRGIGERRLAWLLKVSRAHAKRLLREARRADRHHELERRTGAAPPPSGPDGEHVDRDGFGPAA
jgi:WhiB family redox-sensing transcriptional regulator